MFCREQSAQLKSIYAPVQNMGINIVAIGNGTPLMAIDFVEQFDIPFPIYTDQESTTYQMMNLHYGLGIGLKTLKAGFGVTQKGSSKERRKATSGNKVVKHCLPKGEE